MGRIQFCGLSLILLVHASVSASPENQADDVPDANDISFLQAKLDFQQSTETFKALAPPSGCSCTPHSGVYFGKHVSAPAECGIHVDGHTNWASLHFCFVSAPCTGSWTSGDLSHEVVECVSQANPYTLHQGKHCGGPGGHWGSSINTWSDGTNAQYGRADLGIDECKAMCSAHAECSGFVRRVTDGTCYWKRGTLTPFNQAGHDCYEAQAQISSAHSGWVRGICGWAKQTITIGTDYTSTNTDTQEYENAISASVTGSYGASFGIHSMSAEATASYSHTWARSNSKTLAKSQKYSTQLELMPPDKKHMCLWFYEMETEFKGSRLTSFSKDYLWMRTGQVPKCVPMIMSGPNKGMHGCKNLLGCTECRPGGCRNGNSHC